MRELFVCGEHRERQVRQDIKDQHNLLAFKNLHSSETQEPGTRDEGYKAYSNGKQKMVAWGRGTERSAKVE